MEYNIRPPQDTIDASAIEVALQEVDPAGIVDWNRASGVMRVSTVALEIELRQIFSSEGFPLAMDAIERVPSVCCGGCSG